MKLRGCFYYRNLEKTKTGYRADLVKVIENESGYYPSNSCYYLNLELTGTTTEEIDNKLKSLNFTIGLTMEDVHEIVASSMFGAR